MPSEARQRVAQVNLPAHIPVVQRTPLETDGTLFINRELSWLEFNARVLAEAENPQVPLFERMKFLAIYSTNLDEFFMVRAAGLQAQIQSGVLEMPADGLTAEQQLKAISERAHDLCEWQARIWNDSLRPGLRELGLCVYHPGELDAESLAQLDEHFDRNIYPVLTPIAIDPAHPFPHLRNKTLNVGFLFDQHNPSEPSFGLVQLPPSISRLVPVTVKGNGRAFVTLEDLVVRKASRLFPRLPVHGDFAFRVTRNFDIELDEDEGEDLLLAIQAELRRRERGHAVRLEVSQSASDESLDFLCDELGLDRTRDLYRSGAPLMLENFTALTKGEDRPDVSDPPFSPLYVPPLRDSDDFFATIRQGDVLLHHPYESFEAVIDFVTQAAEDPKVLAIKQTLYRTGGESPLVRALQRAAELGKQVTAVVELKARFDEESNIQWARTLERSGVNVMYGLLGFKTHCKVLLVVRQEGKRLQRYVHLATGNYNQQTARSYEDLSLFTAKEEFGEDATSLFNLLTGYSAPDHWNQLLVAPLGLQEAMLGLIHREREHALAGRPASIMAKMNSLVDADVIAALYQASQAGVQIDLLVRGICCLRPGVPGTSDNIRVRALIDRFLEHARIYSFENGGAREVYCGSSDWMPRNFRRRVEVLFPVVEPALKQRITDEILQTMASDNVKGWLLGTGGRYERAARGANETPLRSQERFIELARQAAQVRASTMQPGGLKPAPVRESTLEKLRRKRRRRSETG